MKRTDILIVGGDMRQLYCAAKLSETFNVSLLGFDEDIIPEEPKLKTADRSKKHCYDCIVLPVPPTNSEGTIFAPCSSTVISAPSLDEMLTADGVIYAGKADEKLRKALPNREIYDYILSEEMSIKNAVPTAEGAVQLALEELPVTLNGLKVLIVGMGRIGTALTEILKGFGADITAAVHNPRGTAKARLHGVKAVQTKRISGNYELVFNTVPKMIFNSEMLSRFDKNTLFIDLASKPGGVDFDAAIEQGIKVIWALGLPGKTAPVTSGEIIAETIGTLILERGEAVE